jgi:hypothetical protein
VTEIVTIVFIGLIAHMDLPRSNTAVMVKADQHDPAMKIFRADGGVEGPYDIDGKLVRISPGKGSSYPSRAHLRGTTPELDDITEGKCKVRKPIVDRKRDSSVFAYIDYEGGDLGALAYQDKMIYFAHGKRWSAPRCAACGTQLDLEVDQGKPIVITVCDVDDPNNAAKQTKYTINGDDWVVFRNAPNTIVSGDHFLHFYELFESCNPNDGVMVAQNKDCHRPLKCVDFTPQLAPRAGADRRASSASTPSVNFNLSAFRTYIITPTVECTNSAYP